MGRSRRKLEPFSPPCKATTRQGEPCKNPAVRGTVVCRMHGVNQATRTKAAIAVQKHVAEARLAQFLQENGCEPVDNPLEALRDLAGEIVAVKDWLRGQVTHLEHTSNVQGEQISALMQLYGQFLDRAERSLTSIAKLNIDERLAHIQQAQAQVMAQVMAEAIMRLTADKQKQSEARVIVGQLLQKYDK